MKDLVFKLSSVIAFILMFLVIVGCTSNAKDNNGSNEEEKDDNIITTARLLDNFNAPNEDFQKAIDLRKDKSSESEEEMFLTAYNQFMEDAFKSYITDDYYDEFTASYGPEFLEIAHTNNYEMNVKFPEYQKTDSDENIYDFSFKLQFRQDADDMWEDNTVNGQVNLNDNNKIEEMELQDTEFLLDMK